MSKTVKIDYCTVCGSELEQVEKVGEEPLESYEKKNITNKGFKKCENCELYFIATDFTVNVYWEKDGMLRSQKNGEPCIIGIPQE